MPGGGVLGAPRGPALKLDLKLLLVVAGVVRFITAWTHVSWSHPDEWHQTVELAGLLVHRWGAWTNEVSLHLRNLAWPFALAAPVSLAEILFPSSPRALFVAVQLFCGLLDLARVWGMWVCVEEASARLKAPRAWRNLGLALILLPAFWVTDSVRPSSEHVAIVLAWVALALAVRKRWFGAGAAATAIFAAKYAVGVFTAVLIGWAATQLLRQKAYRSLAWLAGGTIAGLLVTNAPDWIVYGRPGESLWMYLQYNLFTDLAETQFGQQGFETYWDFIGPRWFRAQVFLMLPLTAGAFVSVSRVWRDRRVPPYAAMALAYALVFALIGHKEPRFLAPFESLWVFLGWMGLASIAKPLARTRGRKLALQGVGAVAIAVNLGLGAAAVWGELGRLSFNFLEARAHVDDSSTRVCAIVTSARVPPQLLRKLPPTGFFPADRALSSFAQAGAVAVAWGGRAPQCEAGERLLLQTHKPDIGWTQAEGCRILPTGWMHVLPEERARKLNQDRRLSGLWLDCPAEALNRFEKTRVEQPVTHAFGRIPKLPRLGASPSEIATSNPEIPYPGGCSWFCR